MQQSFGGLLIGSFPFGEVSSSGALKYTTRGRER
jgi:hypothetical protein